MNPRLIAVAADGVSNRIARSSVWSLYALGVVLAVVTSFDGPYYHSNWGKEHTLFTSASSLQFFIAGLAAYLCFHLARYSAKRGVPGIRRYRLWIAACLAFFFASADEMLCLHERGGLLLANNVPFFNKLYFRCSDDFFIALYAMGAIIFTIFIIRELASVKKSLLLYAAGVVLLVFAALLDYLPSRMFGRMFPTGIEELAEYFAGVSFAASFIIYAARLSGRALSDWVVTLISDSEPGDEFSHLVTSPERSA